MTLVDSSAWIEYLRGTGSRTHVRLRSLLEGSVPIAVTDVIAMEVLAGAGKRPTERDLERLLGRARPLPTRPFFDHRAAAQIYRQCRSEGETPRSLSDCIIAAVAIHHGIPILHADRDFDLIARHTALRIA